MCVDATKTFTTLQFEDLLDGSEPLSEPDDLYGQNFIQKDESPQARLRKQNSWPNIAR